MLTPASLTAQPALTGTGGSSMIRSPYLVTGRRAADVLVVGEPRLNQLVAKEFLPFEVCADGTRMYRRKQLLTVANASPAPGTRAGCTAGAATTTAGGHSCGTRPQ